MPCGDAVLFDAEMDLDAADLLAAIEAPREAARRRLMPAVRTPEASRPTRRIAVSGCCLPRREIGSATSITFDFAALPCGSGLTIRSLAFRPATFLSPLRSSCYQTPRKTRYTAA